MCFDKVDTICFIVHISDAVISQLLRHLADATWLFSLLLLNNWCFSLSMSHGLSIKEAAKSSCLHNHLREVEELILLC